MLDTEDDSRPTSSASSPAYGPHFRPAARRARAAAAWTWIACTSSTRRRSWSSGASGGVGRRPRGWRRPRSAWPGDQLEVVAREPAAVECEDPQFVPVVDVADQLGGRVASPPESASPAPAAAHSRARAAGPTERPSSAALKRGCGGKGRPSASGRARCRGRGARPAAGRRSASRPVASGCAGRAVSAHSRLTRSSLVSAMDRAGACRCAGPRGFPGERPSPKMTGI